MADDIICQSPKCLEAVEQYGQAYHSVVRKQDGACLCERCGAKYDPNDDVWVSDCSKCGKRVKAGELVGLFVPHLCTKCLDLIREEQRVKGEVCRMCRKCYCDCCC